MGKHKRNKKMKKHKKKTPSSEKKKARYSSSESSDSASEEEIWVEKPSSVPEKPKEPEVKLVRDDWMTRPSSISLFSKEDKKKKPESNIEQLGQSSRELNPYWKDGGSGLPTEEKPKKSKFLKPSEAYGNPDSKAGSKSGLKSWKKDEYRDRKDISDVKKRRRSRERESSLEEGESRAKEENSDIPDIDAIIDEATKAKKSGNRRLANELFEKAEKLRLEMKRKCSKKADEVVILTETNSKGYTQPVRSVDLRKDQKKRKFQTHVDGTRVRYFEDDEKYTIKEMFERERMSSSSQQNAEFMKMAVKGKIEKQDMDDWFMDQSTSNKGKCSGEFERAKRMHDKNEKALEDCHWCVDGEKCRKNLIVHSGKDCYICVPSFVSLTEGHCLIVPNYHTTCGTLLDDDVWSSILNCAKHVVRLFASRDQDAIIYESAMNFHKYPHMVLNCVPVPKEEGASAPIYFKKAIAECEKEWSTNKQVVKVTRMDIRKAIPKGLPYFAVSFGMEDGFAHVIEDEKRFPFNFAEEIIGGMLDLDHRIWRKRRRDSLDAQSAKFGRFKAAWDKIDFTE